MVSPLHPINESPAPAPGDFDASDYERPSRRAEATVGASGEATDCISAAPEGARCSVCHFEVNEGEPCEYCDLKAEVERLKRDNEIAWADCADGSMCRCCVKCFDAVAKERDGLRKLLEQSEAKVVALTKEKVEAQKGEHPSGFGWRQEVDALRVDLCKAVARQSSAENAESEAKRLQTKAELRLEETVKAIEAVLQLVKEGA